MKAVAVNSRNTVIASSEYSDTVEAQASSTSFFTNHLGVNSNYSTTTISLPHGTADVERSSGNFYYTQTDTTLPNQEIDFSISRFYNSKSEYSSMFGDGWDFTLNQQLIWKADSDSIWLKDSTGALVEFEKADSGYSQKNGSDYELVSETAENITLTGSDSTVLPIGYSYVLTDKSSQKYYFDACGQLVVIVASNSAYLQYNYDEQGILTSIVSNSGKTLTFSYVNGSNLVSDITLPDKTILHYEYTDNKLVKMSQLSESKEELVSYDYAYNSDGAISQLKDAEDNSYTVEYNTRGNVTSVTYPNGDVISLAYDLLLSQTTSTKTSSTGKDLYTETVTYDVSTGYVTKLVDALGLVTTYEYENGLLHIQTTENSYELLTSGQVSWNDYIKTTTYTYNDEGNVTKEADSDGTTTQYTYADTNNSNLVTETTTTDSSGTTTENTTYEYDENGNVTSTIDKVANTSETSTYEENEDGGQTVSTTEYLEDTVTSSSETKTDEDGNVTLDSITSGTETETGEDIVQTEENKYDEMGRLLYTKDQKGRITEYTYDDLGRELTTTYTSGSTVLTESKTYYPNSAIKSETSKDGTVTSYTYDELNRVITKTISKDGETKTWTTSYEYGEVTTFTGKGTETETIDNVYVEKEVNPDGEITSIKYTNGKGQVVREQASGIYTDYKYDNSGKVVISVVIGMDATDLSEGKVVLSLYDKDGNQTNTITNPVYQNGVFTIDTDNSIVTTSTYDTNGNVLTSTDGLGNTTTYEYDGSARVTKVMLPDSSSQTYEYDITDSDGNVTTKTVNALGNTSTVKVDGSGRTLETTDENSKGDSIVTKECYDSEGNQIKTIYSDGSYKTYEYDSLQRLVRTETYTKDAVKTLVTVYEYDDSDNIVAMKDYTVSDDTETALRYTGYEYDVLGRQIAFYEVDGTCDPTSDELAAVKISYKYDIDGNITSISYANNDDITALNYTYNAYKWLTKITATRTDGTKATVRAYSYHNDGKVKEYKDYTDILGDSGSYELKTYEYDAYDRVTSMSYYDSSDKDQCVESYAYTYDKNSNILSKAVTYAYDDLTLTETTSYTYDSIGQLIKSVIETTDGTTVTTSYQYDAVGNRIHMNKSGVVTEYTYNELNQLVSSTTTDITQKVTSSIAYEYDVKGNETSQTDSVTGEKVSYTYDVANQMIYASGTTAEGDTYTQTNTYNGSGQRIKKIETTTKSGSSDSITEVTKYYYQDGTVLYTTSGSGAITTFNYMGQSSNIIGSTRYNSDDGTTYYVYNKDIQGSTSTIVDEDGDVKAAYHYDDFGTVTELVENKVSNEITYTGAVYDGSTGLFYMNARYYDSETGRFISQDSYRGEVKDDNTWHLYTYCANDPINYVDPSGHWSLWGTLKKVAKKAVSVVLKEWFISNAINTAITAIIGGGFSLLRGVIKKQIQKYGARAAGLHFAREVVKTWAMKKLKNQVRLAVSYVLQAGITVLVWCSNPGNQIYKLLEKRVEKNNRTWNNGQLDI